MVVNLYPFRETVAAGAELDDVIEKIDIGGPAMVRAAAKNFESVGVVVDPARYDDVIDELRREGGLTRATRRALAAAAFAHTAAYDAAVGDLVRRAGARTRSCPAYVGLAFEKVGDLRYGENPHQRGALYREAAGPGPLGGAQVLQGKDMSFNNWLDASRRLRARARRCPRARAVIVKHNNPCGAAAKGVARRLVPGGVRVRRGQRVRRHRGVPRGGRRRRGRGDGRGVHRGRDRPVVHADGAPRRSPSGPNLRVVCGAARTRCTASTCARCRAARSCRIATSCTETRADWKVVSSREPTAAEWADLELAWTIAWRVKSNTIVLVRDGATVGIGAGQMSRVDSSWIATSQGGRAGARRGGRERRLLPVPRRPRGRGRRRLHRR